MIELLNIDCMEYMATLPDKAFDLAIVDPPYNIASQQKRGVGSRIDKTGKMNTWNHKIPDEEFFKELFRVSKNQIHFTRINSDPMLLQERINKLMEVLTTKTHYV